MPIQLSTRVLERIVRGVSCHRRIQILDLLVTAPESLSLADIASTCRVDFRTAGEHVRRLHAARLIDKQKKGREVKHEPTSLGRKVHSFLCALG